MAEGAEITPSDPNADSVMAVRQADALAQLDRQITTDGLMIAGSKGQPVMHPAVGQLRQGRNYESSPRSGSSISPQFADSHAAISSNGRPAATTSSMNVAPSWSVTASR